MRCTAARDGESLLALHGGSTVYMVAYTVLEYIIQKPHSINNTQKEMNISSLSPNATHWSSPSMYGARSYSITTRKQNFTKSV